MAKSTKAADIFPSFAARHAAIARACRQQPIAKNVKPGIMFEYQMVMDKIEPVRRYLLFGNVPPSI
jgi:hypothetical protein